MLLDRWDVSRLCNPSERLLLLHLSRSVSNKKQAERLCTCYFFGPSFAGEMCAGFSQLRAINRLSDYRPREYEQGASMFGGPDFSGRSLPWVRSMDFSPAKIGVLLIGLVRSRWQRFRFVSLHFPGPSSKGHARGLRISAGTRGSHEAS